jgi:hypothetical protein
VLVLLVLVLALAQPIPVVVLQVLHAEQPVVHLLVRSLDQLRPELASLR